jgi:hypothetical protein
MVSESNPGFKLELQIEASNRGSNGALITIFCGLGWQFGALVRHGEFPLQLTFRITVTAVGWRWHRWTCDPICYEPSRKLWLSNDSPSLGRSPNCPLLYFLRQRLPVSQAPQYSLGFLRTSTSWLLHSQHLPANICTLVKSKPFNRDPPYRPCQRSRRLQYYFNGNVDRPLPRHHCDPA